MNSQPKPTPSVQELWRSYRDTVYPGELPADQNKELHQAFFAAVFAAIGEIVRSPEPNGVAVRLYQEAEQYCSMIAHKGEDEPRP